MERCLVIITSSHYVIVTRDFFEDYNNVNGSVINAERRKCPQRIKIRMSKWHLRWRVPTSRANHQSREGNECMYQCHCYECKYFWWHTTPWSSCSTMTESLLSSTIDNISVHGCTSINILFSLCTIRNMYSRHTVHFVALLDGIVRGNSCRRPVFFSQFWYLTNDMFIVRSTFIVNVHKASFHFFSRFNAILQFHSQIVALK